MEQPEKKLYCCEGQGIITATDKKARINILRVQPSSTHSLPPSIPTSVLIITEDSQTCLKRHQATEWVMTIITVLHYKTQPAQQHQHTTQSLELWNGKEAKHKGERDDQWSPTNTSNETHHALLFPIPSQTVRWQKTVCIHSIIPVQRAERPLTFW